LKNLTPICNVKLAIMCNAFLSVLFFIFGIPIIISRGEIVEFSLDYTTKWYFKINTKIKTIFLISFFIISKPLKNQAIKKDVIFQSKLKI
jgi:hypothetical protein